MKLQTGKFACLFALLPLFLTMAWGAETERISVTVGSIKVVDAPFYIRRYAITPQKTDVIKVDATDRTLRIIANKIGEAIVTIENEEGRKQDYAVSVKSNLGNELRKLRKDLEDVPELEVEADDDRIVVKGTVSNPNNWEHFTQVMRNYRGVVNYAKFKPSQKTVAALKAMLADEGFTFCEDNALPGKGELLLKLASDTVMVAGNLYSQEEVNRVMQALRLHSWLDIAGGGIRTSINLEVVKTVLEVDVVFVAISSSEGKKVGSDSIITGTLGLGYLWDAVAGNRSENRAVFGGNMDATVRFLASNGISRTYSAGFVSFQSGTSGKLEVGTTEYVKVNGVENGSLEKIFYGLKLDVSGEMISRDTVNLRLQIENTTESGEQRSTGVTQEQTLPCDLNKTTVLSGFQKIAESASRSGLPILRNIPVLKWFVSDDGKIRDDSRLLVLVCPRLIEHNPRAQIEIPISTEVGGTYQDAKMDVNELEAGKNGKKPWYKRWFGF